jgi:transcriptional regulator with XRE-family HTH domain
MSSRSALGSGLRRRRLDLRVGEKAIADTLGVSTLQIGRWERGEEIPAFDHMQRLVDVLDPDPETARVWLTEARPVRPIEMVPEGGGRRPAVAVRGPGGGDPWSTPPERRIAAPRLDREALVVRPARKAEHDTGEAPALVLLQTGVTPSIDRLLKRQARRDERRFRRQLSASERAVRAESAAAARLQAARREETAAPPAPAAPALDPAPAGAANTGVVFPVPDTRTGSERVTYQGIGDAPAPSDRMIYAVRKAATASVLAVLAGLLWWAFAALGDGVGAVFDLLRGSGITP